MAVSSSIPIQQGIETIQGNTPVHVFADRHGRTDRAVPQAIHLVQPKALGGGLAIFHPHPVAQLPEKAVTMFGYTGFAHTDPYDMPRRWIESEIGII